MDLFKSLEDKGHINKDDVSYLKELFGKMKKAILVEMIEQYETENIKTNAGATSSTKQIRASSLKTSKQPSGRNVKASDPVDVVDGAVGGKTRKSVLILNDEWGTSKGGISTVHRQIAMQARDVGCDVHVTTLQKPSDEDLSDEDSKGINIIPAVKKGKRPLDLECINAAHATYFPDLEERNPDVIIGHIPVTSEGALDIRKDRFRGKRVFQFAHTIPEDTEVFKEGTNPRKIQDKEKSIIETAKRSDVFFSVGPRIYNHYGGKFRGKNVKHRKYIPYPDRGFFELEITPPKPNHPMRILTVGRVDGVAHLKGYDIIAEALSEVCNSYHKVRAPLPKWDIRGIQEDKHEESEAFIDKYKKSKFLQSILHPYGTQEEIMEDLAQSHLFIMPSRSEPFGMVGMEAIAAGLPVLVTKHSGLADFLEEQFGVDANQMIVDVGLNNYDRKSDIEIWRKRIIGMLDPKHLAQRFEKAKEMKKKLRSLPEIIKTHDEYRKMLQGN
ncbi:uncharacterized protein [Ptychodera flava]|uniref:uncharacterized protein n=1 Tax=Ptychodera flava TaxID=63121 RepID=UPI003969C879